MATESVPASMPVSRGIVVGKRPDGFHHQHLDGSHGSKIEIELMISAR